MRPVLFEIFGFQIYSYGVALALAFLVAAVIAMREAKRRGINPDNIIDLTIYVCIAAIVGARLAYIITEPGALQGGWIQVFNVRAGGLAFQGGLALGIAAGIVYCRKAKVDPWKMADVTAAPIAMGYAIARVGGCFLKGCCYGLPADVPWAVRFIDVDGLLRHPTQIYSALGGLTIFVILRAFRDHRMFDGFLMFLFVALYSVERFIVEIYRDRTMVTEWFGLAQIISIAAFILSVAAIAVLQRLRGKEQ